MTRAQSADMFLSHKRLHRKRLPQGRAKVDLFNLGPVRLTELFFQGRSQLLVCKAHGAAVGMVDNGNLVKLH